MKRAGEPEPKAPALFITTPVVWNPWVEGAHALPDMADDEWRAMACVEASNIRAFAVDLAPGEQHTMKTSIRVAAAPGDRF